MSFRIFLVMRVMIAPTSTRNALSLPVMKKKGSDLGAELIHFTRQPAKCGWSFYVPAFVHYYSFFAHSFRLRFVNETWYNGQNGLD